MTEKLFTKWKTIFIYFLWMMENLSIISTFIIKVNWIRSMCNYFSSSTSFSYNQLETVSKLIEIYVLVMLLVLFNVYIDGKTYYI